MGHPEPTSQLTKRVGRCGKVLMCLSGGGELSESVKVGQVFISPARGGGMPVLSPRIMLNSQIMDQSPTPCYIGPNFVNVAS